MHSRHSNSSSPRIERALISVSDKSGLAEFALALHELDIEIYSTGGTARHLQDAGIPVCEVSDYTDFPEMLDGRLKTLHPKVFGGILCRPDREDDMQVIQERGVLPFQLVVINLYPFQATVAKPDVSPTEAIEMIDVGGPSLVRAAAKNHAFVSIVTSPSQYDTIRSALRQSQRTTPQLRAELAAAAFAQTAAYDQAISTYFAQQLSTEQERFPALLELSLQRKSSLRYGENPHQAAALYEAVYTTGTSNLVSARQLNGKELSYNNLLDADAALTIARRLPGRGVSVIKHNNPCGAASAVQLVEATRKAMECDPVSAFGSILGFNQPVDEDSADYLAAHGLFVEAIVAPGFSIQAVEILTTRPKWKRNVRLLDVGSLDSPRQEIHFRCIDGGLLVQDADTQADQYDDWSVVTTLQPDDTQMADLRFAWSLVRHVKSNAIVLCRDQSLVGVGAGQMSRVDSVQIAIRKADDRAPGAVLASDAFFPFPDSIHEAAAAGVIAIIQPGGSRRDQEVIDACNEHGLPMIFVGRRHFKH